MKSYPFLLPLTRIYMKWVVDFQLLLCGENFTSVGAGRAKFRESQNVGVDVDLLHEIQLLWLFFLLYHKNIARTRENVAQDSPKNAQYSGLDESLRC